MTTENRVLCHACCAVCAMYPLKKLKADGFLPIVYFYNPNIFPQTEYTRRLEELKRYCTKTKQPLIIEEDAPTIWDNAIQGFENEPEKGIRCEKCFSLRLEKTAQYAKKHKIKFITTTLTVSPHKNSKIILDIIEKVASKYELEALEYNFKKENGFLQTNRMADEEGFYRQKYCGCKYSIRI